MELHLALSLLPHLQTDFSAQLSLFLCVHPPPSRSPHVSLEQFFTEQGSAGPPRGKKVNSGLSQPSRTTAALGLRKPLVALVGLFDNPTPSLPLSPQPSTPTL